jgi:uncharacterized protein involved in type VI secretion and phage assembly
MESNLVAQLLDWIQDRRFGKYRGRVVANNDPEHRGRLRVRVDAILGVEELWALPCAPYAGKDVGLFAIPEPETLVWVEFEAGDTSHPIWTGCFWAENEAPLGGEAARKVWKTQRITVLLDDQHDHVSVENSSESSIDMTTEVATQAAQSKHVVGPPSIVSEASSGKVEVGAGGVVLNNGAFEVS